MNQSSQKKLRLTSKKLMLIALFAMMGAVIQSGLMAGDNSENGSESRNENQSKTLKEIKQKIKENCNKFVGKKETLIDNSSENKRLYVVESKKDENGKRVFYKTQYISKEKNDNNETLYQLEFQNTELNASENDGNPTEITPSKLNLKRRLKKLAWPTKGKVKNPNLQFIGNGAATISVGAGLGLTGWAIYDLYKKLKDVDAKIAKELIKELRSGNTKKATAIWNAIKDVKDNHWDKEELKMHAKGLAGFVLLALPTAGFAYKMKPGLDYNSIFEWEKAPQKK